MTPITTHSSDAISHLIEFFRKPRNSGIVQALGDQIQEVEDALQAVAAAFDVDTAVGEQLEFLGELVGEARSDRTDADYRIAVRTRVLVNTSNGKLEEMLAICEGIDPGGTVIAAEYYPATLYLEMSGTLSDFQGAYNLLSQAKAAGVRLLFSDGSLASVGSADGTVTGGVIGSADGTVTGFEISRSY